jgi:hypothetical protein
MADLNLAGVPRSVVMADMTASQGKRDRPHSSSSSSDSTERVVNLGDASRRSTMKPPSKLQKGELRHIVPTGTGFTSSEASQSEFKVPQRAPRNPLKVRVLAGTADPFAAGLYQPFHSAFLKEVLACARSGLITPAQTRIGTHSYDGSAKCAVMMLHSADALKIVKMIVLRLSVVYMGVAYRFRAYGVGESDRRLVHAKIVDFAVTKVPVRDYFIERLPFLGGGLNIGDFRFGITKSSGQISSVSIYASEKLVNYIKGNGFRLPFPGEDVVCVFPRTEAQLAQQERDRKARHEAGRPERERLQEVKAGKRAYYAALAAENPDLAPPRPKIKNSVDYPEGSPEYVIVQKRLAVRKQKQAVATERHHNRLDARVTLNRERGPRIVRPSPQLTIPAGSVVATTVPSGAGAFASPPPSVEAESVDH